MKINNSNKKIIEQNPLAFATSKENIPYVIAVSNCKVMDDKYILITDNYMNTVIKNILNNDNISIVVWDKKYKGIQILGKAKYYKKGKYLEIAKEIKENKNMPVKGVILVIPKKIIESR